VISAVIQPRLAPGINRLAKWLAKIGISPNLLSLSGLVINSGAAFLFSQGKFLAAGILMVPGGCIDFLDGSLARVTGQDKGLGSLLDSVADRYSDLVILAGIAFFYASQGRMGILLLVLATMMGFMIVPYARARAEFLIPSCRVGIMERPERWFLLALGAVVNQMPIFLGVLALLTHFTVVQRVYFTRRQLLNKEES
jgi:CDP-diacylglycerol--glycerol-3-phosphate 3-phosphatidyltransferase